MAENDRRALARWKWLTPAVGFMAKFWPAWDEARYRPGGSGYLETLADVEDAFGGLAG